jgi:3-isopropylmalate/(R)-2-methylmalate dehydratase small subunit
MQPFIQVTGPAANLPLDNIDTDVIIRIEHITSTPREMLGHYALQALRLRADGTEVADFVLNQPAFRTAPVLLAGRNFGCGSSRETAVHALIARGIRCVIAPSFGDIFFGNCFQNGLLPVTLPAETIARIAADAIHGEPLTVDLDAQEIRTSAGTLIPFQIEQRRRESLLAGLDDIGLTRRLAPQVLAWQERDRAARPWIWL